MILRVQKGFSLVEIGVVLFIVTLLLAAVLKGDSVLRNARTAALLTQIKDLTEAVYSFRKATGYFPGDMPNAAVAFPSVNATCSYAVGTGGTGPGDTRIDSDLKSGCVTEHLFAAGLIKANVDPQTSVHFQTHPFYLVIDHTVTPFQEPIRIVAQSTAQTQLSGLTALSNNRNIPHFIQIDNLPCNVAVELDKKLDDGDMGSGKVFSNPAPPPPTPPTPICQDPPQLITLFVPLM